MSEVCRILWALLSIAAVRTKGSGVNENDFEQALHDYLCAETGTENLITNWVVVAATVDGETGEESGFTYSGNEAAPIHLRLGLLHTVINDINNVAMLNVLRPRRPGGAS